MFDMNGWLKVGDVKKGENAKTPSLLTVKESCHCSTRRVGQLR